MILRLTYLLLNVFTISVPLLRSFEPRIAFYKKWKHLFPSLLITGIFFLVWDYFKTRFGVWSFSETYTMGLRFFGMPLEEYLFFLTVPYACIFIYETAALFIKKDPFSPRLKTYLRIFALLLWLSSFGLTDKAYTWSVLFILPPVLWLVSQKLSARELQLLFLTYLISLIPMLLVNGLLTGLPVVIYNDAENLGIRLFSIPLEDFLYNFILLSMSIGWYVYFSRNSGLSPADESRNFSPLQNRHQ